MAHIVVAHEHCGVCGACFLHAAQLHRCPSVVDPEVLEVFQMESRSLPARSHKAMMSEGDSYTERFKASHTQSA